MQGPAVKSSAGQTWARIQHHTPAASQQATHVQCPHMSTMAGPNTQQRRPQPTHQTLKNKP